MIKYIPRRDARDKHNKETFEMQTPEKKQHANGRRSKSSQTKRTLREPSPPLAFAGVLQGCLRSSAMEKIEQILPQAGAGRVHFWISVRKPGSLFSKKLRAEPVCGREKDGLK